MNDSRFNSIHLEPVRRQQYRHAREALLHARGNNTLYAEKADSDAFNHTLIQDRGKVNDLDFWLQDEDSIYPLKVGINTVGRSDDNDVVVQDSYVSRRHCAILVHSTSGCELHDTASKNGTFINGNRLAGPIRLKSGDEIRMCGRQLVFRTRHDRLGRSPNTLTLTE
jgi:hypothetical protein